MRPLLALLLLLVSGAGYAETFDGIVIVVIDGDTVLFRPDHYSPTSRAFLKVRLAGIDAPESDQAHGEAATRALKAMALKRRGRLDIVATDTYGRRVGQLEVGGVAVNAELVRRGHAWASTRAEDASLRALQDEAHRARRGLWRAGDPMPPWSWRRLNRSD